MALANVSVNVTALFHSRGTIRALNSRLLSALELGVPFQMPSVYVTLGAPRARVPLDVSKGGGGGGGPSTPRAQRLLFLVIEILRFFHHHRAKILQIGFDLDPLDV